MATVRLSDSFGGGGGRDGDDDDSTQFEAWHMADMA
jgi:hypothetical protein